jgi:hypothetical protein
VCGIAQTIAGWRFDSRRKFWDAALKIARSIVHWEAQCAVRQLVLEAAIVRLRAEASPMNRAAYVEAGDSWEEGLKSLEQACRALDASHAHY